MNEECTATNGRIQDARVAFHSTQKVSTYIWWVGAPEYRKIGLGAEAVQHLQQGTNVLAVYANAAYVDGTQVGQVDVRLEGLKKADLRQEEKP